MKTFVLMMVSLLFAISSEAQNKSFYDFTVKTIDGKDFPLSSLKGKKVLVVNVASKCGLTPQYAQLEKLYEKYKEKDFVVIGFPANNFMGQEPGSNEEIAKFCSLNYDVTFPMMAKISVKGKDMAPLYQWLTEKKQNGKENAPVQWNFQKFMIDENGNWVFEVAAEQQRARQVFIRCFGENAGRGQLQAGEARLLHGRVYGFVIVLLPCNVRDGKLIARHGSVPPTAHKARNIIQFLLFCAKVIAAAAQKRRVAAAQVVVKRGLGQFIVPVRFAGHGGVDLGGRDRRRAEMQQLYISGAGSLHIRPETA